MSSNKGVKWLLELHYGKGCMFRKARIAERIEKMGGIKTYKKFVEETHYKGRKIRILESHLTLHHLQHRSEGGPTTEANGAVVNELAHRYLHSLPRDQEEVINNMLRGYKLNVSQIGITQDGLQVISADSIPLEFQIGDEEEFITIPLEDNTREDIDRRYNRAKEKQELRRYIDEILGDDSFNR